MVLRVMHYALTSRIYKNGAQQSASGAVSQATNGCAAQHSGQLLMFQGKTCSHFGAFTMSLRGSGCFIIGAVGLSAQFLTGYRGQRCR
jgi:hypothetical protein